MTKPGAAAVTPPPLRPQGSDIFFDEVLAGKPPYRPLNRDPCIPGLPNELIYM
jgi:hypothetical protein